MSEESKGNGTRGGGASWPVRVAVFATPVVLILLAILLRTGNDFIYTLDDPYIHLAVAKNIADGGYGVNAGELSAPSSSVVWPFLLVPFAAFPSLFQYAPLIINSLCLILSGFLLTGIFRSGDRKVESILAVVFMLSLNLYGLVFTGMEHSLHVLLVLVVAYGLLNGEELKTKGFLHAAFYLSLIALPLVRYEGLAISIPVLVYMAFKDDLKPAMASLVLTVLSLGAFSAFLYSNGLGILPSSVLAKSSHTGLAATAENVLVNLQQYGWFFAAVIVYCVTYGRRDVALSMTLLGVSVLHLLFGRHGWFGRYEVYYIAFVSVFMIRDILKASPSAWRYVLLLPLCFTYLNVSTLLTPFASSNIKNQHGVMAEVARELSEPVAVNDLGLVALRGGVYVLDLWGLGSLEALEKRLSGADPQWMTDLMASRGVKYAMVYENQFPERPKDWIKVGELKLTELRATGAGDVVSFFATSQASACQMKDALRRYQDRNRSSGFSITSTSLSSCP